MQASGPPAPPSAPQLTVCAGQWVGGDGSAESRTDGREPGGRWAHSACWSAGGRRRGLLTPGQMGGNREAMYVVGLPQAPLWSSAERVSVGPCPPAAPQPPGSAVSGPSVGQGPPDAVRHQVVLTRPHLSSLRDIAKNALLRWRVFIYWTLLGLFDALVFFFGAYFMFENTTVTSNGQVRVALGRGDRAAGSGVKLGTAQARHGRRGWRLGVRRRWSGPNCGALPAAGTPFSGRAGPAFIAYGSPSVIYLGVQLSHPDMAYLVWEVIWYLTPCSVCSCP